MAPKKQCEALDRLKREAVEAVLGAKKLRWSRDVSLYEDREIVCDQRAKIDAFISHLLAGHDGQPCPCGDRPIVGARPAEALGLRGPESLEHDHPGPQHAPQKILRRTKLAS
ncbi:MAG TPA: hypothetical protein VGD60_10550 [Candidatus Acidoferrales bacterium]